MTDYSEFKLCYVGTGWKAWFTTSMENVHGDDWDDAPYQCNASQPLRWRAYNSPQYTLLTCAYPSVLQTPEEFHSESISVDDINRGIVPWLKDGAVQIYAGISYPDFVAITSTYWTRVWLYPPKVDSE